MPVADSVPTLNVDQVCTGIAQQGGVSFHDADITEEKQNCLDSEQATRNELAKQWSSFAPADKTACTNELRMGGDFELHGIAHLPGNGARRPRHAKRFKRVQRSGHAGCRTYAGDRTHRTGVAGRCTASGAIYHAAEPPVSGGSAFPTTANSQ